MANPALTLVLRHNEKLVYEMPACHSPLERIRRFFGGEIADKLIPVESESTLPTGESIRVWGYVGEPSLSKSTRKNQYLFLNGRCIQDRSLQHALEEAYRGLLMVGRHPVSFLFLEMPPALVDVNVHPTKSEVRFQDSQTLYRQLLKTLRDKFLALEFRSGVELPSNSPSGSSSGGIPVKPAFENRDSSRKLDLWASNATIPTVPPRVTGWKPEPSDRESGLERRTWSEPAWAPAHSEHGASRTPSPAVVKSDPWDEAIPESHTSVVAPEAPPANTGSDRATMPASPEIVADEFRAFQIYDCYLVVASSAGLEIIDQHALHERILYEHLRQRVLSGGIERQRLLIPDPIECSAKEAAILLEYLDLLRESGFELEEFGGTTLLLTAYPVLIPRGDLVRIVRDLANNSNKPTARVLDVTCWITCCTQWPVEQPSSRDRD